MLKNSNIIEEKKYKIKTDKNNEMELYLKNINNEELSIIIFNINQIPSKKYELKCNLNEFQKNRFFKIFINIEEIMKELNNKIEKSTFIEENNLIIIDIQIGLTVINEILLEVKEIEKNKNEMEIIINELLKNKEEMNKIINDLKLKNDKLKENMKKSKIEYQNELKKNKEEMNKIINDLKLKNDKLNENIKSNMFFKKK